MVQILEIEETSVLPSQKFVSAEENNSYSIVSVFRNNK